MIISSLLTLALFAAIPTPAIAPLTAEPCSFGIVSPQAVVRCQVTVGNPTSTAWTISRLSAPSDRLKVDHLPVTIKPGATRELSLTWHVESRLGQRRVRARLLASPSTGGKPAVLMLSGSGFVYSVIDDDLRTLDLGSIDAGSSKTRSVRFSSHDVANFRIEKIISAPDFVTINISKSRNTVTVGLARQAQWGLQSGSVVLGTNVPEEPRLEFEVTANVLGDIRPADNPYALGVLRTNNENDITVRLTSMNGKPFKVGEIRLDRIAGDVKLNACTPFSSGCRQIKLALSKKQPTGNLGSQMKIELPDQGKTLTVGFWGILLKPDTKIHDLSKAQEALEQGAKSQAEHPQMDIAKALRNSTAPPVIPPASPPGRGPVLRWSVANEQTLYGYLIYRAEHENGPWQRVNERIIPVLGHDDAPSDYAWRDTSAVKGKTYWYFIKTLANNGSKQKLTEAHKVVAH